MSKHVVEGYYACIDFESNEIFVAYYTGSKWFVCGVDEPIHIDDNCIQRRIDVNNYLLH